MTRLISDKLSISDDHSSITQGWLTDQSQVNIDIHGNAMKMWQPRYKTGVYSIRCSAIDHYKDVRHTIKHI